MSEMRLFGSILKTVVTFLTLGVFFAGCIRIWGGAKYVNEKPGDYTEKTYVLDTGR